MMLSDAPFSTHSGISLPFYPPSYASLCFNYLFLDIPHLHHRMSCHILQIQSIAAMSAASGAASSLAANASAEAAGTYAVQQLASTNDQSNLVWRERKKKGFFALFTILFLNTLLLCFYLTLVGNAAYSQPSADAQYVFSLFDSDSNGYLDLMEAAKALVWAGFAENGPQGEAEVNGWCIEVS